MVAVIVSDKPDGKERDVETGTEQCRRDAGRFLANRHLHRSGRVVRCLTVAVLLAWDGLLLYMIVHCLIEPVYGAAFVAVVSVYLGYQL